MKQSLFKFSSWGRVGIHSAGAGEVKHGGRQVGQGLAPRHPSQGMLSSASMTSLSPGSRHCGHIQPSCLPHQPHDPGDHLLHGLTQVLTLTQGLCRLVLSLAMKLSVHGKAQGEQGHSSSLRVSPPWPLLCTCVVRGQGFQRSWR